MTSDSAAIAQALAPRRLRVRQNDEVSDEETWDRVRAAVLLWVPSAEAAAASAAAATWLLLSRDLCLCPDYQQGKETGTRGSGQAPVMTLTVRYS